MVAIHLPPKQIFCLPRTMAAVPEDAKFSLKSHFDNMAPIYDGFGPVWYEMAEGLLARNPIPISSSSVVHDNGCANGVCSITALEHATSSGSPTIYATDLSPNMIEEVKKRPGLESVKPEVMDAEALTFPDGMFTHSITSMVHPTTLRPDLVTKEIFRTLKPGGVALSAEFASYGWLEIAEESIHKIRPDAPAFKGPVPEEWKTTAWFKGLFVDAGFQPENVQVDQITIRIRFRDMWPEARAHMCHAVVMMVAGSWSEADSDALYGELMKRFDPETADGDGFDHETLLLVARK